MRFEAVVVGAGIHGLCTAFWLVQHGGSRLAVIDRHPPGHHHGSSHGATRITRSSYHEPEFIAMAAAAHRDGWPALERALGRSLRVPTPGVFFGPPAGPFGRWLQATAACPAIQPVSVAEARRRFPLLRFGDDEAVLVDHSAAMLLAAATMASLRAWLAAAGVTFLHGVAVEAIHGDGAVLRLVTASGELTTRCAVVAAGADTPRLVPAAPPVRVLHQQVGYFEVAAPAADQAPGVFPVWARIGAGGDDFQYGLPAFGGAGLKAAAHHTEGAHEVEVPPPAPARLLELAQSRFAVPVLGLQALEPCRYTMTADHGLDVRRSTSDPRLVVVTGCSGHGFKFGPVLGARAAALCPRP